MTKLKAVLQLIKCKRSVLRLKCLEKIKLLIFAL